MSDVSSFPIPRSFRPLLGWLFAFALGFAPALARAVDGDPDLTFRPRFQSPSRPFGFAGAPLPGGRILVNGSFSGVNGTPSNGLAILRADGSLVAAPTIAGGGQISSTYVLQDGRILIGGFFTSVNGVTRKCLARLNADGTLDPTFDAGEIDLPINGFAVQPDGRIIIWGQFTTLGGVAQAALGRLEANGTRDPSYAPAVASTISLFAQVASAALLSDGSLVCAGTFTSVNGDARRRFARVTSIGTTHPLTADVTAGTVSVQALQPDGKLLLAYTNATVRGVVQPPLVRMDANGDFDPGFNFPDLGIGVNSTALQADGKIVVGGARLSTLSTPRLVQRLNADGTLDPTFVAGHDAGPTDIVWGTSLYEDGSIVVARTSQVPADQGLLDGPLFRLKNGPTTRTLKVEPTRVQYLRTGPVPEFSRTVFQLSTDGGTTWSPLGPGTRVSGDPANWEVTGLNLPASGMVRVLGQPIVGTIAPGAGLITAERPYAFNTPDVYVEQPAGTNVPANGTVDFGTMSIGAARTLTFTVRNYGDQELNGLGVSLSGGGASHFSVVSAPVGPLTGPTGSTTFTVRFLPTSSGTKTATLTVASNSPGKTSFPIQLSGIAAVNGTTIPIYEAPDGPPHAAALQADGKLIIGGMTFANVGTRPRNLIARYNVDGSVDVGFNPGANEIVWACGALPDGKVLVAGRFTQIAGTACHGLARLNANGTFDSTFAAPVFDKEVQSIALQPDGRYLVAGAFTTVNGVSRKVLARLNADGSPDLTFADTGLSGQTFAMAQQTDGKVLLCSESGNSYLVTRWRTDGTRDLGFTEHTSPVTGFSEQADGRIFVNGSFLPGSSISRTRLARLNANGTVDESFDLAPNNLVFGGTQQADGNIIISGFFTQVAGAARQGFARVRPTGELDDLVLDANDAGYTVALTNDGQIIALGQFSQFNNVGANRVTKAYHTVGTNVLTVPNPTRVQWLRGGSVGEVAWTRFELSTDGGTTWSDLGTGTRIAGGWELTGLNLPSRGIVRSSATPRSGWYNASFGVDVQATSFALTLPATLASPAAGSATKGPIAVNFTLPQDAAPGSVKLKFFGGTTLVFNSSAETAGPHSYTIDPANPGGSSGVQSVIGGTTIADATGPVSLEYQNSSGDSAATTVNANVTLDTTAPTIAPVANTRVSVNTTLANFLPAGNATDVNLASVVQSPPAGTALSTVGIVAVTITATDTAGNQTVETFDVSVRPLAPVHASLRVAGGLTPDTAPGASTNAAGLPTNAKLTSLGPPATSDSGDVAFIARWASANPKAGGTGLFLNNTCLAIVGGDASAIAPGAKWKSFTNPVVENGSLVCLARLSTGATAVVANLNGPALEKIALTGEAAPQQGDAVFKSFGSAAIHSGVVAFSAQLSGGRGANKVTPATDAGVWARAIGGPLQRVLRESQTVDGRTIATFITFQPGLSAPGQGRGWLSYDTTPRVLSLATFTDKTKGLVLAGPGGAATIARSSEANNPFGPALTGASYAGFRFPALNDDLDAAFYATMNPGAAGVTKANGGAIFAGQTTATGTAQAFEIVARVSGAAGNSGSTFTVLQDPVLAQDGGLAFAATLRGGTIARPLPTLWWRPASGTLTPLTPAGSATGVPNDLPTGAKWRTFTSLAIAADRGPIFTGTLVAKAGGVTAATASGAWAVDFTGTLRTLFRLGDTISGKKLTGFTLLRTSVGHGGVTRSLNDLGEVVWLATFSDKSQAIIRTTVP